MEMSGSQHIKQPQDVVWKMLLDADILKVCVPGCQEMAGNAEEGFEATVIQKVGPVKATFRGVVKLADLEKPNSLQLHGEGKGGPAGFAKGSAQVRLTPDADGTCLEYTVDVKIGGKLAQLGSRIINGFAKKMADQFFVRFREAAESEDATVVNV